MVSGDEEEKYLGQGGGGGKEEDHKGNNGVGSTPQDNTKDMQGDNFEITARITTKEASRFTKAKRGCVNMVEKDKVKEMENEEDDDGKDMDECEFLDSGEE